MIRHCHIVVAVALLSVALAALPDADAARRVEKTLGIDREPEAGEVAYAPADGSMVTANPPTFVWLPVTDAERYVLQVCRSRDFRPGATIERECDRCIEVLRETLEAGSWFWRLGVVRGGGRAFGRTRAFEVPANAARTPFPDVRDVVRRLSAMRPRLGLRAGDLGTFRTQARREMAWAVEPLLKAARSAIGKPLFREPAVPDRGSPEGKVALKTTYRQLRKMTDDIDACAEAYLLTGDERFGAEARRLLMHMMSWDPGGSTSLASYDGYGTHIVRACSRAYDYAYPLLNEADRARCRKVLAVRMGELFRALREIPFESSPFRSHTMGFYVPDLTEACLAMAGEFPVDEMLEYCLLQFWSPYYPPFGGEDGGWSDGPFYWDWYWGRIYPRICAILERAIGAAMGDRALTRNAPLYKIYTNPPWSKLSPFGDGQSYPADGAEAMFVLAAWLHDPYALWYARQFDYRPRGLPAFLFQPGDLKPRAPDNLPRSRCFRDAGLVAMHSALADGTQDVQVLLRSSPYGSFSHGYADQNAFTLDAFGEPLAIESGYFDLGNSPHQRAWTQLTKAANCITLGGEGQPTHDPAARGRIAAFASNDYAHYALGDAHAAYAGRLRQFDRHVLYLRPHGGSEATVVIADELTSAKPVEFQWWLHALEKMQVHDADASVTIQRGAARLRVQFLAPAGLRLEQSGKFPVAPNESIRGNRYPDQWHLTAHTSEPAMHQQFLTVLLPFRAGNEASLPAVRLREGRNCRAVELKAAQVRHVVLIHSGEEAGPMEADGLCSDGRLFAAGFDLDSRRIGSLEIR